MVRELLASSSVYPSGDALATTSAAMLPLAPPRLSRTIGWPSVSVISGASGRATASAPPPGGNGITRRTGFDGYLS